MLADTEDQYQKLLEARPRPRVLDDYTVRRVIKLYAEQREDLALYAQQVGRWADELLTPAQREELTRLLAHIKKLDELTAAILSLAEELRPGTIDRPLEESELDAGL